MVQALWQALCAVRPDFLMVYLGYHHFRSKVLQPVSDAGAWWPPRAHACTDGSLSLPATSQGWIARTGLQYGADMVLYRRHPALAHSEYSVLIIPRTPGVRPQLSWHDIQVSNRLSAQVRPTWRPHTALGARRAAGGSGSLQRRPAS